ncbi:MAG: hypothetical protein EXQ49_01350 [Acidobacteria bacterium]|nr:hypothetical protein [Acidobacteriota bacterium]
MARNIDPAVAESAIPAYIAIDFLFGILAVAGNLVAAFFTAGGFFPWSVWTMAAAISMANIMIATVAGAWL